MIQNKNRYVVITPVRNEEKYIEKTISSMTSQTLKPVKWIIVNDGSTDKTGDIIEKHAAIYNWIKPVHNKDRGFRQAGGGVMEAFYKGYNALDIRDWDFIVKLDGDLEFQKDYFEKCFEYFDNDEKLGISGGGIYHAVDGGVELEEDHLFHVRGATKIYRKACWDSIGGLIKAPGWDTLDELKAHMFGWKTKGIPGLKVIHLRYTGGAEGSWKDWVKNGLGCYISGYHPLFMFFKCVKRIFQRPYGVVPIGLMYGFLGGYIRRVKRVDDKELVCYLRKEQLNSLLLRPSIWRGGSMRKHT
jgi:glycosyltransferase involved in cell wall biosynthesis